MLAQRSRLRAWLGAAIVVLLVTSIGLVSPGRGTGVPAVAAAPTPVGLHDTVALDASYAGLGGEGVDLVWRGQARGDAPALVTIRIEYAGAAAERAMPVWPINVWFFFSADDLRRSFAAELSGSVNWRTGDVRATGLVSDGVRVGTPLELRMRLEDSGRTARVTTAFLSPLAMRTGAAR